MRPCGMRAACRQGMVRHGFEKVKGDLAPVKRAGLAGVTAGSSDRGTAHSTTGYIKTFSAFLFMQRSKASCHSEMGSCFDIRSLSWTRPSA